MMGASHQVSRRNARERRRVQTVNSAFSRLRRLIPSEQQKGKRLSKVKTLQHAIEYISILQRMLHQPHQYLIWAIGIPEADIFGAVGSKGYAHAKQAAELYFRWRTVFCSDANFLNNARSTEINSTSDLAQTLPRNGIHVSSGSIKL